MQLSSANRFQDMAKTKNFESTLFREVKVIVMQKNSRFFYIIFSCTNYSFIEVIFDLLVEKHGQI